MFGDSVVEYLDVLAGRSELKLLDFSKEFSLSVGRNYITDKGAESISVIMAGLNNLTAVHIGTYYQNFR